MSAAFEWMMILVQCYTTVENQFGPGKILDAKSFQTRSRDIIERTLTTHSYLPRDRLLDGAPNAADR